MNSNQIAWRVTAAIIGAALVFAGCMAQASRSYAAPYGGCGEAAQAPHSAGARWCRDHGWTVRKRILVSRRGVTLGHRLHECRNEDGSGTPGACVWNFDAGSGPALWIDPSERSHFVWRANPDRLKRYEWMRPRMVTRYVRQHGRTRAYWARCVLDKSGMTFGSDGRQATMVRCPDGKRAFL